MKVGFYVYAEKKRRNPQQQIIWIGIAGLKMQRKVRISTGLHINPKHWDKKRQIAFGFEGAHELNRTLEVIRNVTLEILAAHKRKSIEMGVDFNPHTVIAEIKHRIQSRGLDFFSTFEKFLESRKNIIAKETQKKYITLINHLKQFQPDLTFSKVASPSFADDFTNYCISKKLANNTILKHFDFLNKFLRWASAQGLTSEIVVKPPIRETDTDEIALSIDDVRKIIEYQPETERLQRVKDLFLFQLFSGQRFSDINGLELDAIDFQKATVTIFSTKTRKTTTVPLPRIAVDIAKKYSKNLPYISNQKMNAYLKELCMLAGICDFVRTTHISGNSIEQNIQPKWKLVSTHTARRSFVTLLRTAGLGLDIIARATNHASILQTDEYSKIDDSTISQAILKGWDRILSN